LATNITRYTLACIERSADVRLCRATQRWPSWWCTER